MKEKLEALERLLTIMDELREKCPWDKTQTLESLRNLTIEETYELADAILENDLRSCSRTDNSRPYSSFVIPSTPTAALPRSR
jgi:hypothetical protein